MPKSWSATRLMQLVTLLHSGRYDSRQIAEHFKVNRRTVFRDLVKLQEAGVFPVYDSVRQKYTLHHSNHLFGLSHADATTLAIALQVPPARQSPARDMGKGWQPARRVGQRMAVGRR